MSAADLVDGQIAVTTDPYASDLVKQIPGARWHEPSGTWRVHASWPAINAVWSVFGANLRPTAALQAWWNEYWNAKAGPLTTLRAMDDVNLGDGETARRLWPLQRVAAWGMVAAERYVVGDEMGGGKTVTTLAALKLAVALHGPDAVFPAIVVCPNKVRRSWRQIAVDGRENPDGTFDAPWWPDLRMEVLPKGAAKRRATVQRVADGQVDVLVVNWEALAGLSRLEPFGNIELSAKEREPGPLNQISWNTVVADEAHRAMNRKAKQTRALKAIANGTGAVGTRPARFRWALTGTLVGDNSAEAWSILNFVDPVAWPAYSRFVDRFATTTWNVFGGLEIGGVKPEARDEFYRCLDPVFIRRLRQAFDPFKPAIIRQTMTVEMPTAQKSAYKALAKEMLVELDGGVLVETSAMGKSGRLYQLAQACGQMVDKGRRGPDGEELLDLQLKMPSSKVQAMLEIVEEAGIRADAPHLGVPVVFGASSRQLIGLCEDALIKAKIPYALIAGGMTDAEQEQNERRFETGAAKVALCVISAAKEGLNSLVAAPTLVFLQKSWSRIDNEQFTARVDRPGQKAQCVTIIDVVSEGTGEEFDQVQKLSAKVDNFQQVVNDERTLRAMLEWKGLE